MHLLASHPIDFNENLLNWSMLVNVFRRVSGLETLLAIQYLTLKKQHGLTGSASFLSNLPMSFLFSRLYLGALAIRFSNYPITLVISHGLSVNNKK